MVLEKGGGGTFSLHCFLVVKRLKGFTAIVHTVKQTHKSKENTSEVISSVCV